MAASVSGHKFYAAETFGGPSCDVIAFPFWGIERRLSEEQKQYGGWNALLGEKKESTAVIMYVKDKAPSSDVLNDPALKTLTHNFGDDESAVALALSIFKHQGPKALLINLPRLDHLGHFAAGGYRNWRKNIGKYMKTVDTLIGRIVDEYKKAGLFEKTVFIVLADHRMATNGKTISPEFIRKKLGKKATSSAARQHRSYIWSFNISEETLCGRAENLAKSNIKYLRAIYIKRKNDGRYSYKLIPHYTDRIEHRLDEAYRFLLDTHANDYSPDLYIIPWENTLFYPLTYKQDTLGSHVCPTWRVQHIPLLISGPGIKKGLISDYPARLVDIAPTILELFNISDFRTDGIILADAIISTRTENLKRQEEMGRIYKPYVDILKRYSDEDLKQIYPEFKDPAKIP